MMNGEYSRHINDLINFGNIFAPNNNRRVITVCARVKQTKKCRYDGLCNGYKRHCKFKLDSVKNKRKLY